MSFVRKDRYTSSTKQGNQKRIGRNRTKKRVPAWDNSTSDLSVHKLSNEELERKRQIHMSANLPAVKAERQMRALLKATRNDSCTDRSSVLQEILYDEEQLRDAVGYSDRIMAVVHDLFGDDPTRRSGKANVTLAPGVGKQESSLHRTLPDITLHPSQLDMLSETVMDQQALNDLDHDEDDYSENSEEETTYESYKGSLDLERFREYIEKESEVKKGKKVAGRRTRKGKTNSKQKLLESNRNQSFDVESDDAVEEIHPAVRAMNDTAKVKKKSRSRIEGECVTQKDSDLAMVIRGIQSEVKEYENLTGTEVLPHLTEGLSSGCMLFLVQTIQTLIRHLTDKERVCEINSISSLKANAEDQRKLVNALTLELIKTQERLSKLEKVIKDLQLSGDLASISSPSVNTPVNSNPLHGGSHILPDQDDGVQVTARGRSLRHQDKPQVTCQPPQNTLSGQHDMRSHGNCEQLLHSHQEEHALHNHHQQQQPDFMNRDGQYQVQSMNDDSREASYNMDVNHVSGSHQTHSLLGGQHDRGQPTSGQRRVTSIAGQHYDLQGSREQEFMRHESTNTEIVDHSLRISDGHRQTRDDHHRIINNETYQRAPPNESKSNPVLDNGLLNGQNLPYNTSHLQSRKDDRASSLDSQQLVGGHPHMQRIVLEDGFHGEQAIMLSPPRQMDRRALFKAHGPMHARRALYADQAGHSELLVNAGADLIHPVQAFQIKETSRDADGAIKLETRDRVPTSAFSVHRVTSTNCQPIVATAEKQRESLKQGTGHEGTMTNSIILGEAVLDREDLSVGSSRYREFERPLVPNKHTMQARTKEGDRMQADSHTSYQSLPSAGDLLRPHSTNFTDMAPLIGNSNRGRVDVTDAVTIDREEESALGAISDLNRRIAALSKEHTEAEERLQFMKNQGIK